jgi:hypothetical protein
MGVVTSHIGPYTTPTQFLLSHLLTLFGFHGIIRYEITLAGPSLCVEAELARHVGERKVTLLGTTGADDSGRQV